MKRWRIGGKIRIKRFLQALNCSPDVLTAILRAAWRGAGRQGVKELKKLPSLEALQAFRHSREHQIRGGGRGAGPGDLVFNRTISKGCSRPPHRRSPGQARASSKREVKKDDGQRRDPPSPRAPQAPIEREAFVLIFDRVVRAAHASGA